MGGHFDVVVIGGGQAGLAVSYHLTARGIDHVVLERGRVGQTWRDRWDSFCLVTPNWSVKLPGGEYDADDPDGYLPRDEIVAHLERYAASFSAPVREGIAVTSLSGGFRLETSEGELSAAAVVVCTGAYQRPHRPAGAETLPPGLVAIDAEGYTNPNAMPPGRVLVVGSGQTGCQLAEELLEAGRDVVLACGRAPWAPRRVGGRDIVAWLDETPFMDMRLADLPSPLARLVANVQTTGHQGGHDLNYRTLQAAGVTLTGRFLGADESRVHFADDLAASVAFGDARYDDVRKLLAKHCPAAPALPDPPPFDATAPESVDVSSLAAVIFTSGFRPDYGSWVHFDAFDEWGFPVVDDGASVSVPGLYFCGVHFMRTRKSSLLMGVGDDARVVAGKIAEQLGAAAPA